MVVLTQLRLSWKKFKKGFNPPADSKWLMSIMRYDLYSTLNYSPSFFSLEEATNLGEGKL